MKDACNSLDKVGATTSLACAVHCALMPLVITFLPLLGLSWLAGEKAEWVLFAGSIGIASTSLCLGFRQHRSQTALRVFVAGSSILVLGRVGDELHWAPDYVVFLVSGGSTIAVSHLINHRLCKAYRYCAPHLHIDEANPTLSHACGQPTGPDGPAEPLV